MNKLISFGVKNLRSLEDTGLIEIKPLTILVGKNSAGKSTFARTLPLLRQTSVVTKKEPILWWGSLVDFGSFEESLNRNSSDKEIHFDFCLDIDSKSLAFDSGIFADLPEKESSTVRASISIGEHKEKKQSRIVNIKISTEYDNYSIHFSDNSVELISVNDYSWEPPSTYRQTISLDSLFPKFEFHRERIITVGEQKVKTYVRTDPYLENVLAYVKSSNFFHGNTGNEVIYEILRQLDPSTPNNLLLMMRNVNNAPLTWVTKVAQLDITDSRFIKLRNMLLLVALDNLLKNIDLTIVGTANRCSYLEPLRATAERYYRKQSLSVAEVDSKGSNVPFFFDSLTVTEKNRFNEWLHKHLNATISAESDGGHLSLKLTDSSGITANLADVGFGFSQVLPIALQLWHTASRAVTLRRRIGRSVIVIEQPELHLHPEYQAKIADLFASAISSLAINLIIETHSPSIINRIGILISQGEIDAKDVQILRFERNEKDICTSVKKSSFNNHGQLDNWPYGFFDA